MKKVELELMKGKAMTIQLRALLGKPVKDRGPVSVHDLARKIYSSLTHSLSELESTQISAADCKVKNRRGCYTRRRTVESWMTYSQVDEDGCAWRKYGQKNILNSQYPRCYYRCTYKSQGCEAKKQVERIQEQPIMYKTTYLSHHSLACPNHEQATVALSDHPNNIINFKIVPTDHVKSTIGPMLSTADSHSPLKQEDIDNAKSSLLDTSSDIMVSDSFRSIESDHLWAPPMMRSHHEEAGASCTGSTSFDEVDADVDIYDQLDDIASFYF